MNSGLVFATLIQEEKDLQKVHLLINSIREFGGVYRDSHFLIFNSLIHERFDPNSFGLNALLVKLTVPELLKTALFGDKVLACATAENMTKGYSGSLVWVDPSCLFIKPPVDYALDADLMAAFRPVHVRNIGSLVKKPLDGFWKRIYEKTTLDDPEFEVMSFIDSQEIRPYFNSHIFSIKPNLNLMEEWLGLFSDLSGDQQFLSDHCQDQKHRVFLFQAVLSSLVVARCKLETIRILPPGCNYPLHLHDSIPDSKRVISLNDLRSVTYENDSIDPRRVKNIRTQEPLRSWLIAQLDQIYP